ncbi:hypothetical protein BDV12DRAFT_204268 [Aspergillus spectabilis]
MPPTFHMNSFKPWAPPHRKPFPPHKSPTSCSPSAQNLPRPKPYHDSPRSTLPRFKHNLPARPPAEVCVPTNADTQFQPQEIPASKPHTYSETPKHGTTSLNDLASHVSEPDVIPHYNPQDNTDIPNEPPPFRGDFEEHGIPSPSISSPDEDLEEFLRPSDAQDDIPIDPVILASHGSWEDMDLQTFSTAQLAIIKIPAKGLGMTALTSMTVNNCAAPNKTPALTHPILAVFMEITTEDSFTALRSHFVSLPFDERLQFFSWLFEGALPRCMSDYKQGDAGSTSRSTFRSGSEQAQRGSTEVQGISRKHMKWSQEESVLLLKLRKDEKRPWAEVTRLFSEEYPGRSSGAIQVYWSTTLSKKED